MTISEAKITEKLDKEITMIVKKSNMDKRFLPQKKDVTYSDFLTNKMLMIQVIKEGIPYSFFNLILNFTPFTVGFSAFKIEPMFTVFCKPSLSFVS